MKRFRVEILGLAILLISGCLTEGPPAPEMAVEECADSHKITACRSFGSNLTPLCYEAGTVGPEPADVGGEWPEFGCVSSEESNISSGPPFYWKNWWCCAARTCKPDHLYACGDRARCVQACDATGLHLGECVCN